MKLFPDDVPSSDLTCSYGDVERFRRCGVIFLRVFSCLRRCAGGPRRAGAQGMRCVGGARRAENG